MYMTMEEIKEKYVEHFVFLINCTEGEYHSITGGEVAIASKNYYDALEGWTKYSEREHGQTLLFGIPHPNAHRIGMIRHAKQ